MNVLTLAIVIAVLVVLVKVIAAPSRVAQNQTRFNMPNYRSEETYSNESNLPNSRDDGHLTILIILLGLLLLAQIAK
ncbi:MAG: hypothetical protein WBR35_10025 [Anaerolineae bacterium]